MTTARDAAFEQFKSKDMVLQGDPRLAPRDFISFGAGFDAGEAACEERYRPLMAAVQSHVWMCDNAGADQDQINATFETILEALADLTGEGESGG